MKYDMRLVNREARDKAALSKMPNSSKITVKSIQNVPCVTLTNSKELNNLIRDTHMKLLEKSMLRTDGHRYDEMGILMELIKPYGYEVIPGKVNPTTGISSVDPTDIRFIKYLASHSDNQLLFMHNHPNNSGFSYGDLHNFIMTDEIKAITAVGNTHGVHLMWKNKEFDKDKALKYFNLVLRRRCYANVKSSIHDIKSSVLREVMKNISKIGIGYRYTESRNYGR